MFGCMDANQKANQGAEASTEGGPFYDVEANLTRIACPTYDTQQ